MAGRPSLVGTPQFTRSEVELGFWGHSSRQECVREALNLLLSRSSLWALGFNQSGLFSQSFSPLLWGRMGKSWVSLKTS